MSFLAATKPSAAGTVMESVQTPPAPVQEEPKAPTDVPGSRANEVPK